jgi:type I restriction enzyme S subunit
VSELPVGWALASIAEVTIEPTQRVPAAKDEFIYIDIASVDRDSKSITSPQALRGDKAPSRARKVVHTGDVLVSMTRPNLNAVALVPAELDSQIASTGFDVLRPNGVDPRWVFGLVRSQDFIRTMSDLVQGALYPAVRSRDVRAYKVPVAPLAEQMRVADKLDTVLAKIDTCRERLARVPQILKKFREAVLEAAVSGRLTEEWRARTNTGNISDELIRIDSLRSSSWRNHNRGTVKPPADPLKPFIESLPPNWRWVSLDRLALLVVDGTHFTPTYMTQGVPFISVKDIRGERIHLDNCKYISVAEHEELSKRCHAQKGDLLVTKSGTIGRVAVVGDEGEFSLFVSVALVKPVTDLVSTPYLSLAFGAWLNSIDVASEITGTGIKNLHIRDLRKVPIALPPLAEQLEIVRRVDGIIAQEDRLRRRYELISSRLEKLTPSVLAKAFRGDLVPQDPNDEPAGEMLEKMRQGRVQVAVVSESRGRNRRNPGRFQVGVV